MYSLDFGKPVGYLLIYNLDQKNISFEGDEAVKTITFGDKTIYIIVVNLYISNKSASQLKKVLPYIIKDDYLTNIEE